MWLVNRIYGRNNCIKNPFTEATGWTERACKSERHKPNIRELDEGVRFKGKCEGTESGKRTFDRLISTEGETCQISHWVWNWAVIAFSLHIQIQSCILITTTLQLICLQHQSNLPPIKRTGRGEERGEENERSVRKVSLELQFFGVFLGFLIFCKTLNNRSGISCYLSGVTICNSLIWGFAFHLHISV